MNEGNEHIGVGGHTQNWFEQSLTKKRSFEAPSPHSSTKPSSARPSHRPKMKKTLSRQLKTSNGVTFASAILLGLPPIVGQGIFETEFLRCSDYLVSGAPDDRKKEQEEKVMVLADEYLRFHERPADPEAWEKWREETIPRFPSWREHQAASAPQIGGIPSSSSTQAVFVPTPTLGGEFMSPNLGAFSPRPDQSDPVASILEALDSPRIIPFSYDQERAQQNQSKAMVWAILDRDGFTKEVLTRMDPHLIASSLNVFNRGLWEKTPENVSPGFLLCLGRRGCGTRRRVPGVLRYGSTPTLVDQDRPVADFRSGYTDQSPLARVEVPTPLVLGMTNLVRGATPVRTSLRLGYVSES
jgi:hypothetical protein